MIEVEIDKSVYLDCYQHILPDAPGSNEIDIELIWGGRDSGKSHFVAQLFTEFGMSLDYFRGLLLKKTHESIKDAQWQMIKDNAEDWEVDPLFKFVTSPLSIRCSNTNTYLTRGMDNAGKIKSLANPSHAWIEEANQLSRTDFITILTGLRSKHGKVKLYLTFNPEADTPNFEDFWIYDMFFKGHSELSFTDQFEIKTSVKGIDKTITFRYRSTHVTYQDNPYVSEERIAFHEMLSTFDYYYYRVYTLGLWGNQQNDSPWAFAFDRRKHVSNGTTIAHPELNRAYPVIASWDFNRNPICVSIIQDYDNHARVLETIKLPKSGVDAMCTYIQTWYPGCLYMVTGDYSGETATSLYQEQVTHYKLIKHYLKLSDGQIKVKPNPRLHKNQVHVNTILAFYKVTIHGEKAKALVFDMENVKKRADGTILKDNRDDPAQQADALDTFRYFCNIFLDWFKPIM
jgi:hypothetical protein